MQADILWSVALPFAQDRVYSSPIVVGDMLYAVSRDRIIVSLATGTGALGWFYDLSSSVRGETWENLTVAGGGLYVSTDLGEVLALRPGPTFQALGVSTVAPMLATPTAWNGRMIFRTYKALVAYTR